MANNFADVLLGAVEELQAPVCVGLDPDLGKIPEHIRARYPNEPARAVFEFNVGVVDATHDIVPVFKPQLAFYERLGIGGLEAYERTVQYVRSKGSMAIADAKRNDIGNTAQAYADAFLGGDPMMPHALTVNPYLGYDGVKPFLEAAAKHEKGFFVLVKTSNPSSGDFQDRAMLITPEEKERFIKLIGRGLEGDDLQNALVELESQKMAFTGFYKKHEFTDEDRAEQRWCRDSELFPTAPLWALVADKTREWGEAEGLMGRRGYSSTGAVFGATYPMQARIARKLMPRTILLGPGYKTQKGTADDAANLFNEDGQGAIINNSRGILYAWQQDPWKTQFRPEQYADAARAATIAMIDDIRGALQRAGKWHYVGKGPGDVVS